MAAQGGDPLHQHERYIAQVNKAIADRPAGMAVTTHMCRGNFRSSWAASGGYDFVAEALFSSLEVDGFFLEYDDERSGSFEPLRFVPPGKMVVLGLVTTKRGQFESKDDLKRRIDEASRYVPLSATVPVAAVRLLVHSGGQRADVRRRGGQTSADRRDRRRGVGRPVATVSRPLSRTTKMPGRVAWPASRPRSAANPARPGRSGARIVGSGAADGQSPRADEELRWPRRVAAFPTSSQQPAQRALASAGFTRLEELTTVSEAELGKLHGMGPKAIRQLRDALAERSLSFAPKR